MQAYPNRELVQLYLEEDVQPNPFATRRMLNAVKKRAFDLLVSTVVTLSVLIWLIPLVSLLIKLTSPGPVLFVQLRTGRNGKPFWCLKFRTMNYVRNAEFEQATLNDSRITRLGHFLRRSNLDEMPQFLNVLAGNMSVVGPRPHPLPLDAEYWEVMPRYRERYAVKPGITGLAQSRGARGATKGVNEMKHRVAYDHLYIRRQSSRLDAKICWWTVKAAIQGNKNAW